MTEDYPSQLPEFSQLPHGSLDLGSYDYDEDDLSGPSLPIVLLSAASAIGFGILSFYLAYEVLRLRVELSAGISTLCLLLVLGVMSTGLSSLIGSRSAMSNLGFSCGLILLMLLFFSLCMISGAFAAILLTLASM